MSVRTTAWHNFVVIVLSCFLQRRRRVQQLLFAVAHLLIVGCSLTAIDAMSLDGRIGLISPASTGRLMPEISKPHLNTVSRLVSTALGDNDDDSSHHQHTISKPSAEGRYAGARQVAREFGREGDALEEARTSEQKANHENHQNIPDHELVYGELSVPVLATLFDAVGVREGERFLDVGSGDGGLVLGASLLYASSGQDISQNAMQIVRGVEIVPGLASRSIHHLERLDALLADDDHSSDQQVLDIIGNRAEIEFMLGNVHQAGVDEQVTRILADTTLAVCFATTWSAGNAKRTTSLDGRRLPRLSAGLAFLPRGARVVIIDGKLNERDGFQWQGDLRIYCPDTAPYSTASLYERI